MSATDSFVSYAQNREDVVLWRALRDETPGTYVDVGANDPDEYSITKAFYERGWRGVSVEPVAEYAERHRVRRPGDAVVEAAITSADVDSVVLHEISGTGLSTLIDEVSEGHQRDGWMARDILVPARRLDGVLAENIRPGGDIHFMTVDTEGSEREVLETIDLSLWRPWVIVVESTAPRTPVPTHDRWENLLLKADYEFCLFDGLSRFYCASEHADLLRAQLSYPACPLDEYDIDSVRKYRERAAERDELREELDALQGELDTVQEQLVRWRGAVLARFADAASIGSTNQEIARLQRQLDQLHRTVSWRVTAPLRGVRRAQRRLGGGE